MTPDLFAAGIGSIAEFVECDVVHDRTQTGTRIQTGDRVENVQSSYAFFIQNGDAISTGGNHLDNQTPTPRPLSERLQETGAPASTCPDRYPPGVQCRFVDDHEA